MRKTGKGLTKTYNRLHNKYDQSAEIKKLRQLHDEMDRAVLDAYGWTNLHPVADFELEYGAAPAADLENDSLAAGKGKKKKANEKVRRRWKETDRDKILFRLLLLNGEYAAEAPAFKGADPEDEDEEDDEADIELEDDEENNEESEDEEA